jgi:large subunit ribosomal protein L18
MAKTQEKMRLRERRRLRARQRVEGTPERPRLCVFRSTKHIYAQVIDDSTGRTLAAASSSSIKVSGGNIEGAKAVGKAIAEKAKEVSVTKVCFDRGGNLFHGRVKALADAAREAGLEF